MPTLFPSELYESGDKSPHSKKDGSLELVFQQPASLRFESSNLKVEL